MDDHYPFLATVIVPSTTTLIHGVFSQLRNRLVMDMHLEPLVSSGTKSI